MSKQERLLLAGCYEQEELLDALDEYITEYSCGCMGKSSRDNLIRIFKRCKR